MGIKSVAIKFCIFPALSLIALFNSFQFPQLFSYKKPFWFIMKTSSLSVIPLYLGLQVLTILNNCISGVLILYSTLIWLEKKEYFFAYTSNTAADEEFFSRELFVSSFPFIVFISPPSSVACQFCLSRTSRLRQLPNNLHLLLYDTILPLRYSLVRILHNNLPN